MTKLTRRGGLQAILAGLAGLLAPLNLSSARAATPKPRPLGRGETRLIEDLAVAVRAWKDDPNRSGRDGELAFIRRIDELVAAEWAVLCDRAGIRVLPTGEEYHAARDRLYAEHDDCIKPGRILGVRFCFDIDEYAPVFGPVAAMEFPTACLPTGSGQLTIRELLPVVEDSGRGKARALSYYLRRGDADRRVGAAIAGSLPAMLRALEEGPPPHRSLGRLLAVEAVRVYVKREAFIVEFFVYATAWREGRYPHTGLAAPTA